MMDFKGAIDILYARANDAFITNRMKLIGLMGLCLVEWWMCTKATADILPMSLFAFVFIFVFVLSLCICVCLIGLIGGGLCVYLCVCLCLLCICVCLCLIGLLGGGRGPSLSGSLADDERWQVLSLFGG